MFNRKIGKWVGATMIAAMSLFLVTSLALACDSEKAEKNTSMVAKAPKADLKLAVVKSGQSAGLARAAMSCCEMEKATMKTAAVEETECAYMKAMAAAHGDLKARCTVMDPAKCAEMKAKGIECAPGTDATKAAIVTTSATPTAAGAEKCAVTGKTCSYSKNKTKAGASVDKAATVKKASKTG